MGESTQSINFEKETGQNFKERKTLLKIIWRMKGSSREWKSNLDSRKENQSNYQKVLWRMDGIICLELKEMCLAVKCCLMKKLCKQMMIKIMEFGRIFMVEQGQRMDQL